MCPTEIVAFSNATSQFASRGAQVVICSTDSEYSLLAWRNTAQKDGGLGPVDVPLLSDKNHQISRDYGVLIEEEGIALRGMFLIDTQGILRQVCCIGTLSSFLRQIILIEHFRSLSMTFQLAAASKNLYVLLMPSNLLRNTEKSVQRIGRKDRRA